MCFHPSAMCELFMGFEYIRMIVIASTRFEIMRLDVASWQRWINNVRRIASEMKVRCARPNTNRITCRFNGQSHIVGANNKYDQLYLRYFTGLWQSQVLLLPSHVPAPSDDIFSNGTLVPVYWNNPHVIRLRSLWNNLVLVWEMHTQD